MILTVCITNFENQFARLRGMEAGHCQNLTNFG